jgi:general secretion pathway protein H
VRVPDSGQKRSHVATRFRRGSAPDPVIVGFTLIEILVVVVIVGVLALAVTISIATAGGERQLTHESERFQALVDHACNEAELTGREIGVRVSRNGYAFAMLGFDGWMADEQKDELRPRSWVPGLQVALSRDGQDMRLAEDAAESPQIVCFSSGELSPFLLSLELGDAPRRYQVTGKANGRIEVASVALRP